MHRIQQIRMTARKTGRQIAGPAALMTCFLQGCGTEDVSRKGGAQPREPSTADRGRSVLVLGRLTGR
jgi:hypothetical protein